MVFSTLMSMLIVSPINHLKSIGPLSSISTEENTIFRGFQSSSGSHLAQQEFPAVKEKEIIFKLLGCDLIAGASSPLVCNVLIENVQNTERKIAIYANVSRRSFSRVVDNNGNEILASSAQLGSSSSERAAETYLTPGVPVRASISFEATPEGGVRLIDLGCYLYGPGGGSFDVEFLPGR